MTALRRAIAGTVLAVASTAFAAPALRHEVIDTLRDASRWQVQASDQVAARLEADGRGTLCLRYDFGRVSGYAVARLPLAQPLDLPAHYAFALRLHGEGAPNQLQFKLADASGDNVWWYPRADWVPPAKPTELTVRQRQIDFAWGPAADHTLKRAAALELAIASGRGGGAGRLCVSRLELHERPAPQTPPAPVVTRSAGATTVDLGLPQEFNGLRWRWTGPGPHAARVLLSDDGRRWREVYRFAGSHRPEPLVWLPDSEARFVRIVSPEPVADLRRPDAAAWPDRNALLKAAAAALPKSAAARAWHGEQSYWTLVGTDGGGAQAALVDEDGAVEPARAGPSLAPLVEDARGQAIGWAEVQGSTALRDGYLPLPQLRWRHARAELDLEVGADGTREAAQLLARYTLRNPLPAPQVLTLVLQLRPWQVNPPQQFLNTPGGVAEVRRLAWNDPTLKVNGQPFAHTLTPPDAVRAAAFDTGDPSGPAGRALAATPLRDARGLASARLAWRMALAPGESRSVWLALPLAGQPAPPADPGAAAQRLDAVASAWRARLNRVELGLPDEPRARRLHDSLRAALAQILQSRDGPALQPGTRSYARSWIRDGAMMVAGLLRMGEVDAAREFVDWYATQLFANGKVPCCVDRRGADPVAENDSHGQFIFAVAELWRHTGDRARVERLWPQVDAAARYMATLAESERTPANRDDPARAGFFGMMPASISHEGYSAKPMHSYWDDFWALAGWRDAAMLARVAGQPQRAEALAAEHARFRDDLERSLAATMARHRIGHLPGAAELGDFDPTSSTMVFSPAGAERLVPPAALEATWQRYWDEVQGRRAPAADWKDYTPYELRSVSSLLRLGHADRAWAMLDFFFADQRPAGWQQWAEVVGRLPREPRFIGDMPHAWVASDYLRSALDLLAYSRDSDDALVLAAGVPPAWLADGRPVRVRHLGTPWGKLGYTLRRDGDALVLDLAPGLAEPPGGVWLAWGGDLHRVPVGSTGLRRPFGR